MIGMIFRAGRGALCLRLGLLDIHVFHVDGDLPFDHRLEEVPLVSVGIGEQDVVRPVVQGRDPAWPAMTASG